MQKLYLLGGENIVKRNAKEINLQAFQDAGGAPNVVVFPWARPSFDNKYKRRKRVYDYFRSIGASTVSFVEYLDSLELISAKVECSDLIYLTGGQLSILISRLKRNGVDDLIRSFEGVIIGRSAGALALCKWCIVTPKDSLKNKLVLGLSLVDIALKVHYTPSNDDFLMKFSKKYKIYAIPEGVALVCEKKELSLVGGKVFLFENERKSLLT